MDLFNSLFGFITKAVEKTNIDKALGNNRQQNNDSAQNKSKSGYVSRLIDEMLSCEKEMTSLMNDISGRSDKDYSRYFNRYSDIERSIEKELRVFHLFDRKLYGILQKTYSEFLESRRNFADAIRVNNEKVQREKILAARRLIGSVEGQQLDDQQMMCIIKDSYSHLVIAGAGTGKTTTILGKVKYLLATGKYKPQEILIISYTNAAVNEMKERLKKETNADIYVATFHKLGYDIIKRAERKAPDVFDKSLSRYVFDELNRLSADPKYAFLLANYILFHRVTQRTELQFNNEEEYIEYLQNNPPTTIREETVKSYGEMNIANFLTQNGIAYEYEPAYKFDTASEEHRQYHPDFYLPEYDVYIEYFGVDRNGEPPRWFADGYKDGMKWKRKTHSQYGTRMIECYAYENMDGTLIDSLRQKLTAFGVPMKELSFDEIIEQSGSTKNNHLTALSEVISKIINLAKNRRISAVKLMNMCLINRPDQVVLMRLTMPVMQNYEIYLQEHNLIDFTDMVNRAAEHTRTGVFQNKFKCAIIDEYQDISSSQYMLMKALREQYDYELFCVGDDWQSIYRFAGSDIGYILNFGHYWADAEMSKIETTYRFSQALIDISGGFIMSNPYQYKKYMRSGNNTERYVIGNIQGYTEATALRFMIEKINDLPKGASVFLIGRYGFDIDKLKNMDQVSLKYDNRSNVTKVYIKSRPDLDISFYTAHKSKGLQADYVFIINNKFSHMGFPSKVQNPPLVDMLLESADKYPDAEERRLYYVALTRARKKVYLVTVEKNVSVFAAELISKYETEMKKGDWRCPLCGGDLRKINGKYGVFYGCSNYRLTGCRYKRQVNKTT